MSTADRGQLNRSAALASIGVAFILVALKSWAAWSTGSTAMLGSLADTALDLIASLATLAGVWIAAIPADEDHRFGHGKAEALAAMLQVVLITLSAFGIGVRSLDQLINGARPEAVESGIAVSAVAMAATLLLLAWQRHVIRKTGSLAIATDHLHYKSDLLLNLAVIAALALDQYGGIAGADSLFGLVIAVWLAWSALRASTEAIDNLMDREWPEERKARFLAAIPHHPLLRGVHDLRTRMAGHHDFAQFHVWVDGGTSVRDAHRMMEAIEAKLKAEFPDVEILIHPDPEGHVDLGMARANVLPDRK
jgi:ferrous-iron efflux pump FieF